MSEIVSKEQLKQFISRIERLENDKSDITDDIKQVYDEAKANGFDTKIMKKIIKIKNTDRNKLEEEEAILELYRNALDV
jgi:uncharacterized protein (UPF0335 family)